MLSDTEALDIKRRVQDRLLAIPGVHAVGFGGKVSAGQSTGEFAIRVQVLKKKPSNDVPTDELVPTQIDGVATDVVESTPPVLQAILEGGIAIHNRHPAAGVIVDDIGTLGCFARTVESPSQVVLLSNDHVLYGVAGTRNVGDPVELIGCCCDTVVARISRRRNDQDVDAAIALVESGQDWQARVHGVPITGTLDLQDLHRLSPQDRQAIAARTYPVFKHGGETGATKGIVSDLQRTSTTRSNQIEVMPIGSDRFSQHGDSGSVIYNNAHQVVALLWGAESEEWSPDYPPHPPPFGTYGSPIKKVEVALGIVIATNPPAVIYRVPGKPSQPGLGSLYRDLAHAGQGKRFVEYYGRHQAEISGLLRHNRAFIVAWHRNHGPTMVGALNDLVQHRIDVLPEAFGGQGWDSCVHRIAEALLVHGSSALKAHVVDVAPLAAQLGGRSYTQAIGLLATFSPPDVKR